MGGGLVLNTVQICAMARSILLILALPYTLRFSLFEQYWALCFNTVQICAMARSILLILALPYTLRFSLFEQYWALCLSWWGCDRVASRNPDHSSCHQDKHKAPTRLHVHPLSLQDAATRTSTRPNTSHLRTSSPL